jgi:hypothetical protein
MTTDDFVNQLNRPLGPGMPEESAGLAPSGAPWLAIGTVRGVNDRWARLVENFRPTEYELVVLAKHYLDESMDVDFFYRCYQTTGSSEWRIQAFASRRLDAVEQALGEAKFNAAIAKRLADWKQKFADADKEEESLPPCTKCRAKRYLYELTCGGDRTGGLCERCIPHEPAHLTPCANCGCERGVVGSAYTGDLCWDCASERLAPCANCGGKRELGPRNDALCDDCLRETIPPCKYCGAKRHPAAVSTENDHGYCGGCTW